MPRLAQLPRRTNEPQNPARGIGNAQQQPPKGSPAVASHSAEFGKSKEYSHADRGQRERHKWQPIARATQERAERRERDGERGGGRNDRESHIGLAYNKNSIASKLAPRNYDGLLRPELKDKIAFAGSDTGVTVIGAMLKFKGEEYVKKLKSQNPAIHNVSGRALLDLVISGEVGVSPTIFRNHVEVSLKAGAPKDICLIADEAQYLKTPSAQRSIRFRGISNAVRMSGGRVWLLTGTPLDSNPSPASAV